MHEKGETRRVMARPRKDRTDKRSQVVNLRLTLAEHEALRSQAHAAGLSVAELLRRRALGQTVRPAPQLYDAALISELNRIGVNVNQLARATHRGADFIEHWQEVAERVSAALEKVIECDDP